jgi:REP element-mobilizing transposase RayT
MPRGPRIEYRGGLYHVLNRGIRRETIFHDTSDYEKFLEYLSTAQKLYPFICYGYVLMPNHFHLIVERLDSPFSSIMKSLLGSYASFYNSKYKRSGHVFQGRYHSILCQKEIYLQELIRYIYLNPVRAGFVELPDKWKWSSYNAYFGEEIPLMIDMEAVLNCFGKDINKASEKLFEFINDDIDNKDTCNIYPKRVFPVLEIRHLLKI